MRSRFPKRSNRNRFAPSICSGSRFLRSSVRRGIWHAPSVGPLLRFGGWMTVSNIVGPLMVTLDRFLIAGLISVTAVAYYATPYELVTKLLLVPVAVVDRK